MNLYLAQILRERSGFSVTFKIRLKMALQYFIYFLELYLWFISHHRHLRISKNVCLTWSFSVLNEKICGKDKEESAYYKHEDILFRNRFPYRI
jgi:hypothetical protein